MLSSFESFDSLFTGRELLERVIELLVETAERALHAEPLGSLSAATHHPLASNRIQNVGSSAS
jgi:hypothetical protein